jgi:type IV secretion system protein VirB5
VLLLAAKAVKLAALALMLLVALLAIAPALVEVAAQAAAVTLGLLAHLLIGTLFLVFHLNKTHVKDKTMKSFKKTLIACAIAVTAPASFAQGIPTMDIASIIQQFQQVMAWAQQYQQMIQQVQNQIQQIEQQAKSLENMSGSRLLGMAYNNIAVTDLVPEDIAQQLKDLKTSADLLTNIKATAQSGLASTQQRGQQIQNLMSEINNTTDAKGVAEMQARMTAESASVANDANRIALLDIQQKAEMERVNNDIKTKQRATTLNIKKTTPNYSSLFD